MKNLSILIGFLILVIQNYNAQNFNHIKYKKDINSAYVNGLNYGNYQKSISIIKKTEKKYGKLLGEDYLLLSFNLLKSGKTNESAEALKQAWSVYSYDLNCLMQIDSLQPMVLMNQYNENQKKIVEEGFKNFSKLKTPLGDSLYKVFEKINELDQIPREKLFAIDRDTNEIIKEIIEVDSINLIHFREIILRYGYPGEWLMPGKSSVVGLILIHSTYYEWFVSDMQETLKKEVIAGRMAPSEYVLWLDKHNLAFNKKLEYGILDVPSQQNLTEKQKNKIKRKRLKYGLIYPFPIPSTQIEF